MLIIGVSVNCSQANHSPSATNHKGRNKGGSGANRNPALSIGRWMGVSRRARKRVLPYLSTLTWSLGPSKQEKEKIGASREGEKREMGRQDPKYGALGNGHGLMDNTNTNQSGALPCSHWRIEYLHVTIYGNFCRARVVSGTTWSLAVQLGLKAQKNSSHHIAIQG